MIGTAVQRGSFVYIYDEKGHQIGTVSARHGLVGYTGSTVTVSDGGYNYIYNEKGHQIGTVKAK